MSKDIRTVLEEIEATALATWSYLEDECLHGYDGIEINPCTIVMIDGSYGENYEDSGCLEACDDNCPHIVCWSVYGHLIDGGLKCMFDFATEELAQSAKKKLMPFVWDKDRHA